MSAPGSKLWQEKPIAGSPAAVSDMTSVIQQVTIRDLYFLVWKIAIATMGFALPFWLIYYLVTLK
jgi:hypothetical protein